MIENALRNNHEKTLAPKPCPNVTLVSDRGQGVTRKGVMHLKPHTASKRKAFSET